MTSPSFSNIPCSEHISDAFLDHVMSERDRAAAQLHTLREHLLLLETRHTDDQLRRDQHVSALQQARTRIGRIMLSRAGTDAAARESK